MDFTSPLQFTSLPAFIDLPTFTRSPTDQLLLPTDPVQLEYEIKGATDYIAFQISMNNGKCTSSQCNVSITPLPTGHGVHLMLKISGGALPPDNYSFQMCAHFNEKVSSHHVEQCDCKLTCSDKAYISIQRGQ